MNFDEGQSSSPHHQGSLPPEVMSSDETSNDVLPVEEENYEQTPKINSRKRKNYSRHTPHQIQEMEKFFKKFPHPDEKQRNELGCQIGLNPLQVKFWFQNKRTQIKSVREHNEHNQLQNENEKLLSENMELKKNRSVFLCGKCGNPQTLLMTSVEHQLKLDNEELQKEIDRIANMTNVAYQNIFKSPHPLLTTYGDTIINHRGFHIISEFDKSLILELCNSALEEVDTMARIGEPVWIPDYKLNNNSVVLNEQEYFKIFQTGFTPKPIGIGYKFEASRECNVIVNMSPLNIVEIFMELSKWLAVFSGMISKAMLIEVLSTGVGANYNGALQLIAAKFQALSPAIPTRDCVFVRYSKQLNEETWAVIDVSVDTILPNGPITNCQRRPSGCIIQTMPNGCSKITWVEHVQVKNEIDHTLSWWIIDTGVAYGAKRWISILGRQCERLASVRGTTYYPYHQVLNGIVVPYQEARQNILNLSERMVLSFCGGITSSSEAYHWTIMSGNGVDDVRIMSRKSTDDDPGRPHGLVISASICFLVPVPPKFVFNYIQNESNRAEWDILSIGGGIQRMACFGNGQEPANCVTILRTKTTNSNEENMVIIQESSSEATMSYIIYTPMDEISANKLFIGENPENIQILPSGFTIIPSHEGSSLISVGFQILIDSDLNAIVSIASIATVKNLIESTVKKIKKKFGGLY